MTEKFSKAALRGLRTRERMTKMQAAASPVLRVVPADDDGRRLLKHPHSGGFPETGAASWPDDRFTKRRLADGSVTLEEEPPPEVGEGEARQRDQRTQSRHRVEHKDEPNDAA
jgi:hypothetical protein